MFLLGRRIVAAAPCDWAISWTDQHVEAERQGQRGLPPSCRNLQENFRRVSTGEAKSRAPRLTTCFPHEYTNSAHSKCRIIQTKKERADSKRDHGPRSEVIEVVHLCTKIA